MDRQATQFVMIKGTKEGLIFYLDDDCSFNDLIGELKEKLAISSLPQDVFDQQASVIVKLGYRYVTDKQKEQLRRIIEENDQLHIERYESEVIDKITALDWIKQSSIQSISRIVRSGQVLEVEGDLLLIGDVNPGGQVNATGNIFIMGKLKGIAHAGVKGDEEAIIAAAYMSPMQLRIAKYISRAPDFETEGVYMECGYFDRESEKIIIDRLQVLPYIRKQLRDVERRIYHG